MHFKIKKRFFLTATLLLMITIVFAVLNKNYLFEWNVINCSTHMIIKNSHMPETQMEVYVNYRMKNGKLLVRIEGEVQDQTGESGLSRLVYIDYKKNGNNLSIITNKIVISPVDKVSNETLKNMLPPFYLNVGASADIYIYPFQNVGYVFSTGMTPSLICLNK